MDDFKDADTALREAMASLKEARMKINHAAYLLEQRRRQKPSDDNGHLNLLISMQWVGTLDTLAGQLSYAWSQLRLVKRHVHGMVNEAKGESYE